MKYSDLECMHEEFKYSLPFGLLFGPFIFAYRLKHGKIGTLATRVAYWLLRFAGWEMTERGNM